ncbi:MAG: hypothetical protein HZA52_14040 [Planctomycetes bacterium]|nr:hypothetical protein [Planctomycetota bacterium]
MKFQRSLASCLAIVLVVLSSCGTTTPNLVARGVSVKWQGGLHYAEVYVVNGHAHQFGGSDAGPFRVYVDGDETPISQNYRPQKAKELAGLAWQDADIFWADFSGVSRQENLHLANVKSLTVHVDPKDEVDESHEDDNTLTTPLPESVGANYVFGYLLVPRGHYILEPGYRAGQNILIGNGQVIGIEVALRRCGLTQDVPIEMSIRSGTTLLATASVPSLGLPLDCSGVPASLSGPLPGAAFFDFRSNPISVAPGSELLLEITNSATAGDLQLGITSDSIGGSGNFQGTRNWAHDLVYRVYYVQ